MIIGFPRLGVTGNVWQRHVAFQAVSELALNRVNQANRSVDPEENIRISEGLCISLRGEGFLPLQAIFSG
jgi:hypothetical protein